MHTATTPRWVRTGLMLAGAWATLVAVLVAKVIFVPPSFEQAASAPCPQLLVRLLPAAEQKLQAADPRLYFKVVIWRDSKSRDELTLFRRGEQALSCTQLEQRAKLLAIYAKIGVIRPTLHLRRSVFTLVIVLPALVLLALTFLVHRLFRENETTNLVPRRRRDAP